MYVRAVFVCEVWVRGVCMQCVIFRVCVCAQCVCTQCVFAAVCGMRHMEYACVQCVMCDMWGVRVCSVFVGVYIQRVVHMWCVCSVYM